MADISVLRERLRKQAKINQQTKEKLSNDEIDAYLRDAIYEHAPSLNGSFESLPASHEQLVILLAWIQVCHTRASQYASETDVRGPGEHFSHEAKTPTDKNLKLAAALQMRYDALRAKLIADGALDDLYGKSDVIQSQLYRREETTGIPTDTIDPIADAAILEGTTPVADGENPGTYYTILTWTRSVVSEFYEYIVFKSLNSGIYEPWNYNEASAVKGVNDGAESIFTSTDRDDIALKVISLQPDTKYYFLVVTVDRRKRYAYSNEVEVEYVTPVP